MSDIDISMYFYSSTDKISNILLITTTDTPKKNHVQTKYVQTRKAEISGVLRNFC